MGEIDQPFQGAHLQKVAMFFGIPLILVMLILGLHTHNSNMKQHHDSCKWQHMSHSFHIINIVFQDSNKQQHNRRDESGQRVVIQYAQGHLPEVMDGIFFVWIE